MTNNLIPFIEDCYFLSRENNVIIANLTDGDKVPLLRFTKSNFINLIIMEKAHIEYMEKYMAMFPDYWELIDTETKNENSQLTLF
jgi:hypothetical protein